MIMPKEANYTKRRMVVLMTDGIAKYTKVYQDVTSKVYLYIYIYLRTYAKV